MPEPQTRVPKFASFRPKPSGPSSIPLDKVDEEKQRHGPRGRNEPYVTNDRTRHRQERLHRSRSKETNRERAIDVTPSHPQFKDEVSDIFVIDRKGDVKNLVYGSIHRYSVPPFHRIGAGGVVGASSDTKIDRDSLEEKGIVLGNRRDFKSTRKRHVFSKAEWGRPRLLKIRSDIVIEDEGASALDYLPLTSAGGKKRKRTAADNEDPNSDHDETHHRSIQGKAKARNKPVDDDPQFTTESDTSDSDAAYAIDLDFSIRQRTVELNRRIEQVPNDIDAWLALIDHQDTLIRPMDERRRVTHAEVRSTAEIKIHMYEKALEKIHILGDRERLLSGLMSEGSKIWEIKVLTDRWEQISKDNINSLVLWKSYLDFKQGTFTTFQYDMIRAVYAERIKLLCKVIGAGTDDDSVPLFQQLIYVLLRFTIFIRESGYSELAVAIWQGLLEYNFCAPPKPLSRADKIELFQEFWESEVPRIGEDTALGWHDFVRNGQSPDAQNVSIDEESNILDSQNVFGSWAVAERLRGKSSRVPARTMDEVVEDDPFRVILFSDIEQFLVSIPSHSETLRGAFLDAFLLFCCLWPVSSNNKELARSWAIDPFIGGEILEWDFDWVKHEYLAASSEDCRDSDISDVLKRPPINFPSSVDTLFGGRVWFRRCEVWRDRYAGDRGPLAYDWVRNTIKQLTQWHFGDDLAELYLAFEWQNEPETVKKVTKSLLKQHPASLRLYNAYAMIEWSRGNDNVASGVFSAAIGMGKSMSERESRDSILLWKNWVWGYLESGDNISSLNNLLSMANGAPKPITEITPAVLLKTRQRLSTNRDYLLSSGHTYHAILYAECLALLEYLTSTSSTETQSSTQGNITSGLSIFTEFSQTLTSRYLAHTTSHELLLQSATRLLFHHARTGPFRPALLRHHLTHFITLFPQNTIFLHLYSWNESRLRIDNRVRTVLLSTVMTPEKDTLTSRLFAISYEIKHGTIHSVRSAFEHALSTPSAKSSAALWKLYLLYCLETPRFRTQAKEVWIRGIRACPWAKELYIFGFEKMGGLVPFAELRETWRVMGEKELRVHVDLEESFDELNEAEIEKISGRKKEICIDKS